MVSIIPGIDAREPLRTETSRGFAGSPNRLPVISSVFATYCAISSRMSCAITPPSS